jgi:tetraacyldisaccharide 4'-kinase
MSFLYDLAERIRRGDSIPAPIAIALAAATPAVRFGMFLRSREAKTHVDARVISIGNITAGGTGKTPAVIERARREIAAGHTVAILTRGYGVPSRSPIQVFDGTSNLHGAWKDYGDEPVLIAKKVPGALIARCADRVAAAQWAVEERKCDTLILDDGFQYLRLHRDADVVLIDATNPFGNEWLLPRGILREPIDALRRATEFILTRCDQGKDVGAIVSRLRNVAPNVPVRTTRHAPSHVWHVKSGRQEPLDFLRGKRVGAMCAIANPEAYFETLERLGAHVEIKAKFQDHHDFSEQEFDLELPIVVTEKDAIRFEVPHENLYALGIQLEDVVIAPK